MTRCLVLLTAALGVAFVARGEDAGQSLSAPRTRAEVKKAVEVQKNAAPNLPMPPEAERTRGNNGAMQRYYLPREWQQGGGAFGRRTEKGKEGEPDRAKARDQRNGRDNAFTTQLFWIVSRTNDCRYCLGHQEAKLTNAGLAEEQIARLDGDWSDVPPEMKPALAYARKITLEPHNISDADVAELKKQYPAKQVLSIISSCAGFNRMNRWTGSLNIPQDREPMGRKESLDGAPDPKYANIDSPMMPKEAIPRPPLEPRADVEAKLAAARTRSPRVELPAADGFVDPAESNRPLPAWTRIAGAAPEQALSTYKNREAILSTGRIPTLLKAKIMWTTARNNRAWYALADAQRRLKTLGFTPDQSFAVDNPDASDAPTAAALAFARKLTIAPQLVGAEDFKPLKKHFSDHEVAEIVWATASGNYFDRLTEPVGLPVED